MTLISQPIIDLKKIRCDNCPARHLKRKTCYGPQENLNWLDWVKYCENLREKEAKRIIKNHGTIRLYILTESIPCHRFIYDLNSSYPNCTLRYHLCEELLNIRGDCKRQLIDYLKQKGILIVDCALCPLHKLQKKSERRLAATICLNNNTGAYLNINPNAPIIAIFPRNCGFLKTRKPHIAKRIVKQFGFKNVRNLKDVIKRILGDC